MLDKSNLTKWRDKKPPIRGVKRERRTLFLLSSEAYLEFFNELNSLDPAPT
jgi:hypothetical protein